MRSAARFLMEMRRLTQKTDLTMFNVISADYFDLATKATLNMCRHQMDDEFDLSSPSYAIKFKFVLIRMAYSKIAHSIRMHRSVDQKESEEFIKLLKIDWS